MTDKKNTTPEETPLHELVLAAMFEVNKERPAELSATDVFYKMSDPNLSQRQVTQVLDWLVNEKRVEVFSGKYSLDRFEFLDQRSAEQGPFVPKKDKNGERIPLHEVVLEMMFEAGGDQPIELTASDLYWKSSDPSVSESQITEVLNWLAGQKRVDKFAGKYSMTPSEFIDQKKLRKEETPEPKKTVKPKKVTPPKKEVKPAVSRAAEVAKKPAEKKVPTKPPTPKPVKKETPISTDQKVEKALPKKALPKKAPVQKTVEQPAPKVEQVVPPVLVQQESSKAIPVLLGVAAVLLIYAMYLMFSLESISESSTGLANVREEIASVQQSTDGLLDGKMSEQEVVNLKLEHLKKVEELRSRESAILHEQINTAVRNNSLLLRLVVSAFLLVLITGSLHFLKRRK